MIGLFKKKKTKCLLCKTTVNEAEMYTVRYRASDGNGSVKVCKSCADELDKIADMNDRWKHE